LDTQKKSWRYRERDEAKRQAFRQQLSQVPEGDRVYIDQAGVDDTHCYAYGWSAKGTRCAGERLGHRSQRIWMAAAWCCGTVLSPLTFEGYCDSALIEAWFETQLCKVLRPGQVVILDNASFHRQQRLRVLLEQEGCALLPLPPYSPDLNKIEPLWHTIKTRIAHNKDHYPTFRLAVDAAFL